MIENLYPDEIFIPRNSSQAANIINGDGGGHAPVILGMDGDAEQLYGRCGAIYRSRDRDFTVFA